MKKIRIGLVCAISIASLSAASRASDERVAPPLPKGVSATDANLGPLAEYPWRMDFSFPRYEGIKPVSEPYSKYKENTDQRFMDLQVVHGGLVIIGNDYTFEGLAKARAHKADKIREYTEKLKGGWPLAERLGKLLKYGIMETYDFHVKLDQPDFFRITSTDDPDYRDAKHPNRVTKFATRRGNFRDYHIGRKRPCAAMGVYFAHYSYVFLPTPMKGGHTYIIQQGDGRKVSFLFHEDMTISRAIKVNQSGYGPRAGRKYAYLGLWQAGFGPVSFDAWQDKTFEVVDANTREVVHTGKIELLARNPFTYITKKKQSETGEDIFQLDLSSLKATGEFYIRIKGVGRSWPFYHDQKAIGRAFYVHLRGLFHQRAGHALEAKYTGWPRPAAHQQAYFCDEYIPRIPYTSWLFQKGMPGEFGMIAKHMKKTPRDQWMECPPAGRGGVGGWYDAADYDRRWHHYHTVFDLLLAYEIAPENFTDGQEHTYESENGIPDILDEAAWGLLCWKHSQRENGGVSSRCEQRGHPSSIDQKPDGRPHHDKAPMFYSAPTREGSLRYAAAASRLARLLKPFDAKKADDWLASAQRAYAFGRDSKNHFRRADYGGSGKGLREHPKIMNISWCMAGLQMYLATGEKTYLDEAVELYPKMKGDLKYPVHPVREDFGWAFYKDKAIPETIRDEVRRRYIARANKAAGFTNRKTYRSSVDPRWPHPPMWGMGHPVFWARDIIMGYGLTREQRYLDAAALCADWEQGCNPLGLSWTSGLGYSYPWCFMNFESEEDGILDPVPGITIYGVTGGFPWGMRTWGFNVHKWKREIRGFDFKSDPHLKFVSDGVKMRQGEPYVPFWRRWVADYHEAPPMQEYTVNETMSPNVLVYGVLLGKGWQPSESLRNMKPRHKDHVFGLWMTP